MLAVKQLNKVIEGQSILEDISFTLSPGQIVGLLGRNGAGKTTLFRTMMGIILPDSGDVTIEEHSVYTLPTIKEQMIYVPDYPAFLQSYTVEEIIQLYKDAYPKFDEDRMRSKLAEFKLPTKHLRHYSKGMIALFSILLAFSTNATYYLLDEPTNGLDVVIKKQVIQLFVEEVAENKSTLLISSHMLEELEKICDSIMFMKHNTIDYITTLEEARTRYKKVQLAFPQGLPEDIRNLDNVHVLSELGRVSTLLIKENLTETLTQFQQYQPLLVEELPLTLEEIFITHLGEDYYVS